MLNKMTLEELQQKIAELKMIIDSRENGPKTFHLSVRLPESLKISGDKKQNFGFFEDTWKNYTGNYFSYIFRKINDFVILDHKSVDFTILVVNFTILYC
jgi:hypothetical protein